MSSNDINKLLHTIDEASSKFNSKIPAIEQKMLEEISLLLRDLQISNGKIASNVSNLKLINKISRKLEKVVLSKEYVRDVTDFVRSYNTVATIQQSYFKDLPVKFKTGEYYNELKNTAISNTVEALTESGIRSNVVRPITQLLLTGVTSGQSYARLEQTLRNLITESGEGVGLLNRYVKTYTIDSIAQFSGEYMSAITNNLEMDWYVYRGSNIKTTREFCKHLTQKEFIHKSEIPTILEGNIDGHQCKIYDATGLPYGLKEGTNPDNFQANRGGWNCQHQLIPVPDSAIPNELRSKFKKKRYTDMELEQIKKKEKDTLNYGRENIIGQFEFKHSAFDGQSAKFTRNSFTENLRYGETFNDKVDILKNIESMLSDITFNRFEDNIRVNSKPTVDGYYVFNGDYKDSLVEYFFEKRKDGNIVFHFIKLH